MTGEKVRSNYCLQDHGSVLREQRQEPNELRLVHRRVVRCDVFVTVALVRIFTKRFHLEMDVQVQVTLLVRGQRPVPEAVMLLHVEIGEEGVDVNRPLLLFTRGICNDVGVELDLIEALGFEQLRRGEVVRHEGLELQAIPEWLVFLHGHQIRILADGIAFENRRHPGLQELLVEVGAGGEQHPGQPVVVLQLGEAHRPQTPCGEVQTKRLLRLLLVACLLYTSPSPRDS